MIKLTIDGKTVEVIEGTTVLQAAEEADIYIPTLCHHPQLTPYGGCRMCMVDIEGARTLQPSCTLPASDGMVIRTNTEKVIAARKFVLTLIFSERNHFCMYCPVSDGDCELQNRAYDEDMTHWDLQPNWLPFEVDASHPFIVLDNNRCILCRRCVRACDDLVGNYTLGFEERGANSLLVADYNVPLGESTCISCGTCVQICPTGALIDRQSAYQGKEIEVENHLGVCVECSVGCQRDVLTRDNRLVRIEGDWDAPLNHGLLCEKGRFLPLEEDRLRILTPMVRENGQLKATTWENAIKAVAEGVGNSGKSAALASTRLPLEDLSLFKTLFKDGLQANLVTSLENNIPKSSLTEMAENSGKTIDINLDNLKDTDVVLSLGADLVKDHQVAGFFVKRQLLAGTKLIVADSKDNAFAEFASQRFSLESGKEIEFLQSLKSALGNGSVDADFDQMANTLHAAEKPCIVYGAAFTKDNNATALNLLIEIAEKLGAALISIQGKANSYAAAKLGLTELVNIEDFQSAFVLLSDEEPTQKLTKSLEKIPFVVIQAAYSSQVTANADVVLPVTMWAEQSGTYVNLDGRRQKAVKALDAPDGILTSFEALQKIADVLNIETDIDWEAEVVK